MSAIKVENIVKTYGSLTALKGVSMEIERGELFGLIGPDGAGKTSLFKILATLLKPDSGKATVEGYDVVRDFSKIRELIGYMPGRFSLYQELTVEENINFFATLYGTTLEENYDLVKDIYSHIEPFKTRRAGKLSGGMKQKLALSCSLIHRPKVLLLDEPTTGIDPVSRKELWRMLKDLRKSDITVVVSTPYMDEATMCDRIVLMQEGEAVGIDTPSNIIANYTQILWSVKADKRSQLLNTLRKHPKINSAFAYGDTHHITVSPLLTPTELRQQLSSDGYKEVDVHSIVPTIEDCYVALQQKNRGKDE